jgi:hypothetical protein
VVSVDRPVSEKAGECAKSFAFGVQGSGIRDQGSGFRVQGSGLRVQGAGYHGKVAELAHQVDARRGVEGSGRHHRT